MDASSISHPGAPGTAWRPHAAYDPLASRFTDLELTGPEEMESFTRLRFAPGEVAVGDRGYARAADLRHALDAGADFVVRIGWSSLALLAPDGAPLRWAPVHAALGPGEVADRPVLVARPSKGAARRRRPLFPARFVVLRLPAAVEERALRAARRAHSRRRAEHRMQPLTASSCGYLMVLTSLPPERVSAGEVLAAYRLRWQVELAFKRLKGGLGIGRLLARDREAARSWLLALLVEEGAAEVLAAPPLRRAGPSRGASLWRLHRALRDALLAAVLRPLGPGGLATAAGPIVRHICDPPRRRPSQSALALCRRADIGRVVACRLCPSRWPQKGGFCSRNPNFPVAGVGPDPPERRRLPIRQAQARLV